MNKIDVEIFPLHDHAEEDGLVFEDVNYISFVSSPGGSPGTFGIPAILSDTDKRSERPVTVLYVNPANIVAMKAVREA